MRKIIYILFLVVLVVSCTKDQPLTPTNQSFDNGRKEIKIKCPLGITDPDKDDKHDGDNIDITDPDKDGDHDKDTKPTGPTK